MSVLEIVMLVMSFVFSLKLFPIRIESQLKDKRAIKPHDRLVLVR